MRPADPSRVQRDIGRRISELRRERELTQEQLAEKVGVSVRYLQGVERGEENLTVQSLATWANELGVTPRALFDPPRSRTVRPGRPRKSP